MAQAENQELVDRLDRFYRNYYREAIAELAQHYPAEQRSLHVDWNDLYQFDPNIADDYLAQPEQLRRYAEEALRVFDLPVDVSLGQAHVRVRNLPSITEIRAIRSRDVNTLVSVQGIIRKATEVRPKIEEAAFECQRCGTLTYIPQAGKFQEPHQCQGCERQGPFSINYDQSTFVDAQKLRVQESPEGLRGGETPQSIDVHVVDDIAGRVTPGDHVTVTGVLRIEQQGSDREKSRMFDVFMDGHSIVVEDEEFENMDITETDKRAIVELSQAEDIYEEMVDSIAPTIYGYDEEKFAIVLQLFSGVTKHLPDESRIRGDLHMLLVGDPGTGKCVAGDTNVTLGDGSQLQIRELVERHLDDPTPVDDGVYDEVDIPLPSMVRNGRLVGSRATKVWKREAPETMFRVRTASGRTVTVTPSHPLFVDSGVGFLAVRTDRLDVGDRIATVDAAGRLPLTDGGRTIAASTDSPSTTVRAEEIVELTEFTTDEDWVYDLEVEGTHAYLANDIVSHNSQLLQYIRNIAPRSVYTSGKGSSAAGLCVTGDTVIQTTDGLRRIDEIVEQRLPEPVATETAVEQTIELQTFDRDAGEMKAGASSYVWRMPEKPCHRIETIHGKELEASVNTPILTCGEAGVEWKPITEIESGDFVAVPRFNEITRRDPPILDYFEFADEKLKLSADSLRMIRKGLYDEFDTLRNAAATLQVSADLTYLDLWNKFVPFDTLQTIIDSIDVSMDDLEIQRAMRSHGTDIRIPDEFSEDLMYLIGLVFGIGDISIFEDERNRGQIRLSIRDERILQRAADIIEDSFEIRVEIQYGVERGPYIQFDSLPVARFFENVGMQNPKHGLALDERLTTVEHSDAFLRGLMDAAGSVSARDSAASSILISITSEKLARQIQLMLETYGVGAIYREHDRRGTTERPNEHPIESEHRLFFVEINGIDIGRYADTIGFDSIGKQTALETIVRDADRREKSLPIGAALATVADGTATGSDDMNFHRGINPGRGRSRKLLHAVDLGETDLPVRETVDADLRWDEVVASIGTGEKEVFDLTVPETHNFVGNGIITHNTAAAVRDDFAEGNQWTLEAGALVLADKGIASIDELDKMDAGDRSALHEALEQQSVSISKAGINATLKSRCSLLGAANPKYGRFDQYEPIAEQIELDPALISRFDLIFTVTDQPDEERDAALADHILQTNYAGELNSQRAELSAPNISQEQVETASADVEPAIDPELFRKYIAYAKRNCFPTMTDEARKAIRDFYIDLRARGTDEDAPVPVTARKLEALVRLSEASARVRLSDTVEREDAQRVIDVVRSSLRNIGIDPETGEFDVDMIETGRSKTQRERIKNLRTLIQEIEDEYDEGAPVSVILDRAEELGMDEAKAEHEIEKLKQKGEVYEPSTNTLRTT